MRKELNFEFEQVVFWSNAMIILNYIHNENRRFQIYMANRVGEIRDLTSSQQWVIVKKSSPKNLSADSLPTG